MKQIVLIMALIIVCLFVFEMGYMLFFPFYGVVHQVQYQMIIPTATPDIRQQYMYTSPDGIVYFDFSSGHASVVEKALYPNTWNPCWIAYPNYGLLFSQYGNQVRIQTPITNIDTSDPLTIDADGSLERTITDPNTGIHITEHFKKSTMQEYDQAVSAFEMSMPECVSS